MLQGASPVAGLTLRPSGTGTDRENVKIKTKGSWHVVAM